MLPLLCEIETLLNFHVFILNTHKHMGIKVVEINQGLESITCDTTLVTADSTLFTADNSLTGYYLKVPYRRFSPDIKLIIQNERTLVTTTIETTATDLGGQLEIYYDFEYFNGESYEGTMTDLSDNLIWRGKLYATNQTDLENFSLNKTNDNIIRI